MQKIRLTILIAIFLCPAHAEQQKETEQGEVPKIKVNVENVMLRVTILEDSGNVPFSIENYRVKICPSPTIFDLWKKIKERRSGDPACVAQKILSSEELHQYPLRVIILTDTSNSTAPRIDEFTKKAILELIGVLGRKGDEFSLWEFTDTPRQRTDWTGNGEEIKLALDKLEAGGNTAIFDSLYWAAQEMKKFPSEYTKIIFLITDGFDTIRLPIVDPETGDPCPPEKRIIGNYSLGGCRQATTSEVVNALQETGTIVYDLDFSKGYRKPYYELDYGSISSLKPLNSPEELENLAIATGGQRFLVRNTKEAAEAFKKVAKIVSTINILWFAPSLKEPGWYDVIVEIGATNARGEFKVNKKFRFKKNLFYRGRYRMN